MKVDAKRALAASILCGGSLTAADFNRSKQEIMYPTLSLWRRASLILSNV
jgi:hypothetical protein